MRPGNTIYPLSSNWRSKTTLYVLGFLVLCFVSFPVIADSKCSDTKTRDVSAVYQQINSIVSKSRLLTQKSIGNVVHDGVRYDIMLVSYKPSHKAKYNVFINGGLHGDEPAGVESVAEYIKYVITDSNKHKDLKIDFLPLVNPWGWSNCNRLTAQDVDINRDYHQYKGQEVGVIERFLKNKQYDLMIDHHEDPRDHVDAFYIVTYANKDLSAIKNALEAVTSHGFKLRPFKRTVGYFNVKWKKMRKLKNRTFMLYARTHYSANVYQVETPTVLPMSDRVKLHNLANDVLIQGLYE